MRFSQGHLRCLLGVACIPSHTSLEASSLLSGRVAFSAGYLQNTHQAGWCVGEWAAPRGIAPWESLNYEGCNGSLYGACNGARTGKIARWAATLASRLELFTGAPTEKATPDSYHLHNTHQTGRCAGDWAPTSQNCEAVSRRARIQGSYTFVSLNSRLKSNKEEKEEEWARTGKIARWVRPQPLKIGLINYLSPRQVSSSRAPGSNAPYEQLK